MSYYTYFKPTVNKYNPNGMTDNEVTARISDVRKYIDDDILGIKTVMIDTYYDYANSIMVKSRFWSLKHWLEELNMLDNIQWIEGELKEYGMVGINHANCHSKGELELFIDNHKQAIDNCLTDLLILSKIRFNKEDYPSDYNEGKYLRYDYQEEIDSIIDNLKETEYSLSRDKFMLDNFDTKKDEGELEREEAETSENKQSDEQSQ